MGACEGKNVGLGVGLGVGIDEGADVGFVVGTGVVSVDVIVVTLPPPQWQHA